MNEADDVCHAAQKGARGQAMDEAPKRRRALTGPATYTARVIDVAWGEGWRPLQPKPCAFATEHAAWEWLYQTIGDCGLTFRVRSEERPRGPAVVAGPEAYTDHRGRSTER